ncbi:MAG: hypothetical protein QXU26_03145 [Thermofilaceae archaeon]
MGTDTCVFNGGVAPFSWTPLGFQGRWRRCQGHGASPTGVSAQDRGTAGGRADIADALPGGWARLRDPGSGIREAAWDEGDPTGRTTEEQDEFAAARP